MNPGCVNNGGPISLLRLARVPLLEEPTPLSANASSALGAWQARPGEILTVTDPEGGCYRARLLDAEEGSHCCVPFERLPAAVESRLRIEVYQALPAKERFELVLEKLTELGAARLVPVETERSVTLAERDARQRKSHRWPDIIRRAARQCRRAMLPELFAPMSFDQALNLAADCELKLLLYEGAAPWTFGEGLGDLRPQSMALMIGPEGGFTAVEVAAARDHGILPVRLGPRLLRTETAAIAATCLAQGLVGDLA